MSLNTMITADEAVREESVFVANVTTTRATAFVTQRRIQTAEEPHKEKYRECVFSSPGNLNCSVTTSRCLSPLPS